MRAANRQKYAGVLGFGAGQNRKSGRFMPLNPTYESFTFFLQCLDPGLTLPYDNEHVQILINAAARQQENKEKRMKTKMIIAVTIIGVLVMGVLALPATAQAASSAATRTPIPLRQTLVPVQETLAALPTPDGKVLEDLLIRERLALSNQQTRLTLSHTVAGAVQTYIDGQKNAGKDTSSLESALNAFTAAISSSEADNAAAAALLSSPAGFDANGKVVDRETAHNTLRTAGQSLRQAHLTITQATLNLRQALQTYLGR